MIVAAGRRELRREPAADFMRMMMKGVILLYLVAALAALAGAQKCNNNMDTQFPAMFSSGVAGVRTLPIKNTGNGAIIGYLRVYPLTPYLNKWWAVYTDLRLTTPRAGIKLGWGIYGSNALIPGTDMNLEALPQVKKFDESVKNTYQTDGFVRIDQVPSPVGNCCGRRLFIVVRFKYRDGGVVKFATGKVSWPFKCATDGSPRIKENTQFGASLFSTGGEGVAMDENSILIQRVTRAGLNVVTAFRKVDDQFVRFQTFTDNTTEGISGNFGSALRVFGDTALIRLKSRKLGVYRQNPDTKFWKLDRLVKLISTAPGTAIALSATHFAFVAKGDTVKVFEKRNNGVWRFQADLFPIFNKEYQFSLEFDARGDLIACRHLRQRCIVTRYDKATRTWSRLQNLLLANPLKKSFQGNYRVIAASGTPTDPRFVCLYAKAGEFFLDIYGKARPGGLYSLSQTIPADLGINGIRTTQFTVAASSTIIVVGGRNKASAFAFKLNAAGRFEPLGKLYPRIDRVDPRLNYDSPPAFPERGAGQVAIFNKRVVCTILDDLGVPEGTAAHILA